jgi:predicted ArsR family transcriptional regulator
MRYSSVMTDQPTAPLDHLAVLAEPIRRRLYEYVAGQAVPVDRDEAALALGIGRPLAAFHLDRLVKSGLLDAEFHRRSGRTGPGAGQPAKFYRRATTGDLEVSLPPRRYGLAAEILADGLDRASEPEAVANVLNAAREVGERLANSADEQVGRAGLVKVLRGNGYEPFEDGDGAIRLRNCPFHALAERHRQLTCSMNLALLSSLTERVSSGELAAEARPADGFCCVAFVPTA